MIELIVVPKRKKNPWPVVFNRLEIYMNAKKELDTQLRAVPGGNIRKISKLYKAFDKAIFDEAKHLRK